MPSDWRDDKQYDHFDDLGVSGLAWECLRRNSRYRDDYELMREGGGAPIFWLPTAAPAVVQLIDALPDVGLTSANPAARIAYQKIDDDGISWVRLKNGVNLVGNLLSDRPVGLLLPLDDDWAVRLAAADRLYHQLVERDLHPPITRQRRERLKRALRTIDGRQRGASYRAVATVFFGAARVSAEPWKTSSLKAQIARLAAYGRMMIDHGYRNLLKGQSR